MVLVKIAVLPSNLSLDNNNYDYYYYPSTFFQGHTQRRSRENISGGLIKEKKTCIEDIGMTRE